MKLYFKRGVMSGFIITLLVISGLGVYAFVSIRKLIEASVVQSRSLLITYVITGDSNYLQPYDRAFNIYDVQATSSSIRPGSIQYVFTGALIVPAVIVAVLFYSTNANLTIREQASVQLQRAKADVTKLNSELESFTYSVSHDLLNFSRIGRKQLLCVPLEIDVRNLPNATVDNSIKRQVWYNLISNALKYSDKTENPAVDIGSFLRDNDVCYYVKDNGVGFNMAYADKLFGIFQRLHKQEEFEGTGVGLALIKRIIDRAQWQRVGRRRTQSGSDILLFITAITTTYGRSS